MKKPKHIQIDIPHPCSQSWEEMTPVEQGRFCMSCQKTVIDFTTWSDTALYNFFSTNTGNVCGRYLATQVGRPINIPYQPHSKLYRITVTLGLTLLFAQTPHLLLAQNRPPLIAQTDTSQQKKTNEKQFGEISGRVFDDKKEPLPSAVVQVLHNGEIIGGVVTDYDGNYSIKTLSAGNYDVLVRYVGYDSVKVTSVNVSPNKTAIQNINMNLPVGRQQRVITILGGKRPIVDIDNSTK